MINETEMQKNENGHEVSESLVVAQPSNITPDAVFYGVETLSREDITLPRIKLLQAMSDEVSNGAKAGEWYNTLSGQSYGDAFDFIPITVWKSRTYFHEDRNEAPICRSADGLHNLEGGLCANECPFPDARDWKDGIPPKCVVGYNYLIMPVDDDFPAITTLMKTSYHAGKSLNTLLVAARCSAWFWVYELYSQKQTNNKGTFFVAAVRKKIVDGKPVASSEEQRQIAEYFYKIAKGGKLQFDDEVPF